MPHTDITSSALLTRSRQQILFNEIAHALSRTPNDELQIWGINSAKILGRVMKRRATNVLDIGRKIGRFTAEVASNAKMAYQSKRLGTYMQKSAQATRDSTLALHESLNKSVVNLKKSLKNKPKETIPGLIVSLIAFCATSGGPDGDGGAPDLDLLFGIDAHRSIFTHSILSGAIIETLLVSAGGLISLVHAELPTSHDPIWDLIAKHKDKYLEAATSGVSMGIAYHLFVDATIQAAPYHDLPGAHSMAVHQSVLGSNAFAEGIDAGKKKDSFREGVNTTNGHGQKSTD